MTTLEAVSASEARLRTFDQRLNMARGDIRKREAALSSADALDREVDGLAKARARADVLVKAREAELTVLEKHRGKLTRETATEAQAEAARLFEEYKQHEAELRDAVKVAVAALMPHAVELARLGAAVQDANRRGGNTRVYACHQHPTLVAGMVGALLKDGASLAMTEHTRPRQKATA